ncbi:YafY family transcriptional regulator [Mesorhizobium sp. BR1-1-16]|uniref:helix-turn-helix transcriptional regulator n=1 Tax=Mesorhizobium sp. BR1-1-16 TaxID=2876653 RepID=UPI001CCF1143|nr:YafY family protein [Mesorhizobium sp. BR1-1-16]MBZ9937494.1 YafY family transcriptional regulator [Mesorhizobium sp. BR1-1-16]
MRRADRLFQLIQILRRTSLPVTAAELAEELEVSKRSVYRDIADLIGQRVPIHGEAGFGYVLESGFDMPPLMLTADEVEAAVLGAQWVADKGDPVLAAAARDLIAKISAALPERLRELAANPVLAAAPAQHKTPDGIDVAKARLWIRDGKKIRILYQTEEGAPSERIIWPAMLGYTEHVRLLAAWCELRQDFRLFRLDRIVSADFLDEHHGRRPGDLRSAWRRQFAARAAPAVTGE